MILVAVKMILHPATGYNALALGNVKRWAKLERSTPPEDIPTREHWNEVWVNLGTINLTNTKLNINTNYLPLNQIFKTGPV